MQNSQAAPEVGPTKYQESAEGGQVRREAPCGTCPLARDLPAVTASHLLLETAICPLESTQPPAFRTLPVWGPLGEAENFPISAHSQPSPSPSLVCYWMQVLDSGALGVAVVAGP